MATYSNLGLGSSGDEVKKLQQSLINAGYNVGSTGADGKYGPNTAKAVAKYQAANGLKIDGIAGNNTLGKLFSADTAGSASTSNTTTGSTETSQQTESPTATTPDYSKYKYDPGEDDAYQQALAALQNASKEKPTYTGSFNDQLEQLYQQIINRGKFKYDLNSDMLYQQYKDQYADMGRMAMKDTMGQAAALTGGYGSSYGQAVGQQQYDAYLKQLNDVVPELYGMAYDQYQQEGNDLYQQYALVGDMADDEYGKYMDSLDRYWQEVAYLTQQAESAYEKGYTNWHNSYQIGTNAQNNAYARLTELMTLSGYNPTDSELAEAGMTRQQADDYLKGWKAANPDLAYRTGAITAEEYRSYTGTYPPGYAASVGGGGGSPWEYGGSGWNPTNGSDTEDGGGNNRSYSAGELQQAAWGNGENGPASKAEIEQALSNRGIDVNDPAVQADIKWALGK